MQEKRLAKLEAGLDGREKVLAWLHVNQQRGGLQDLAIRRIETNGASVRLPDMEDVESRFIYLCWRACNLRVLELKEAGLQKALLALCVGRFLGAERIPPDELFELQAFREALKVFVLQWMLLDRVVEIISEEHFSGMRVLYDDTAAILEEDLETARIYLAGFNVKIAPRLGIEPITSSELDECLRADAPREADAITSLARATAELEFGNRLAGYPLAAKVLCGYKSKAWDGFRQITLRDGGRGGREDDHGVHRKPAR
jgi:hypothetical protein